MKLKDWYIKPIGGEDRRVEMRKSGTGRKYFHKWRGCIDRGEQGALLITVRQVDGEFISTFSTNDRAAFNAIEISEALCEAAKILNGMK